MSLRFMPHRHRCGTALRIYNNEALAKLMISTYLRMPKRMSISTQRHKLTINFTDRESHWHWSLRTLINLMCSLWKQLYANFFQMNNQMKAHDMATTTFWRWMIIWKIWSEDLTTHRTLRKLWVTSLLWTSVWNIAIMNLPMYMKLVCSNIYLHISQCHGANMKRQRGNSCRRVSPTSALNIVQGINTRFAYS